MYLTRIQSRAPLFLFDTWWNCFLYTLSFLSQKAFKEVKFPWTLHVCILTINAWKVPMKMIPGKCLKYWTFYFQSAILSISFQLSKWWSSIILWYLYYLSAYYNFHIHFLYCSLHSRPIKPSSNRLFSVLCFVSAPLAISCKEDLSVLCKENY